MALTDSIKQRTGQHCDHEVESWSRVTPSQGGGRKVSDVTHARAGDVKRSSAATIRSNSKHEGGVDCALRSIESDWSVHARQRCRHRNDAGRRRRAAAATTTTAADVVAAETTVTATTTTTTTSTTAQNSAPQKRRSAPQIYSAAADGDHTKAVFVSPCDLRTYDRLNERTHERTNERTNERTTERTNEVRSVNSEQ